MSILVIALFGAALGWLLRDPQAVPALVTDDDFDRFLDDLRR